MPPAVGWECFEEIVFPEDAVWAGFNWVKLEVGTCFCIGFAVGGFVRPVREWGLVACATCWLALL